MQHNKAVKEKTFHTLFLLLLLPLFFQRKTRIQRKKKKKIQEYLLGEYLTLSPKKDAVDA